MGRFGHIASVLIVITVTAKGQDVCLEGGYTVINDPSRSILDTVSSGTQCDGNTINRAMWYRFTGAGGNMIPETCPPKNRCRTHATAFINGTHPTNFEVKSMTACIHWSSRCCYKTLDVKVKLCPSDQGNFYVYQLNYPTPSWCSFRFCTVNNTAPTIEPPSPTPPSFSNPYFNFTCPDCKLTCPKLNFTCPDCKCPDVQLTCPKVEHLCPACNLSCPKAETTCPACQTTCPALPNISCPACDCPACSVTCSRPPGCNLTCPSVSCSESQGETADHRSSTFIAHNSPKPAGNGSMIHSSEVLGLAIALSFILGGVCGGLLSKLVSDRKKRNGGWRAGSNSRPTSSPRSPPAGGMCSAIDNQRSETHAGENPYDELLMLANPRSVCNN